MSKIAEALVKRFESNRIIFWYDEKEELLEQFNEISIENVEKIHVQGNEFEIKQISSELILKKIYYKII